jgi:hypothetical protein
MKTRDRPTSLQSLIHRRPALARLKEESALRAALLSRVRDILPQAARPHLHAVSLASGCLHLTVDAAAWAGRLRLMGAAVRRDLAVRHGIDCDEVTVAVRPGTVAR